MTGFYETDRIEVGERFEFLYPKTHSISPNDGAEYWWDGTWVYNVLAIWIEGRGGTYDRDECPQKNYIRVAWHPDYPDKWPKPNETMVRHLREYGVRVQVVNLKTGRVS